MFEPAGPLTMKTVGSVFVTVSQFPGVRHRIDIPAGYEFDGASIPRFAWSFIGAPFEPDFIKAACVHDWYCEHTAKDYQSRVIGDAVFFKLLAEAKVPKWRRTLMFLGVRIHSWWNYGRAVE